MAESLELQQLSSNLTSPDGCDKIDEDSDDLRHSNILDYSFPELHSMDLEEALLNEPYRVIKSVETILATNISLSAVPLILDQYSNLKSLDLSFNQIAFIPESLTSCSKLSNLVLKNNLLDENSFPLTFSKLTQLKELNLSGNEIKVIPEQVLELGSSLLSLHLGANRLAALPKGISKLKKLQIFYLGGNLLTELPSEIGTLTQLKVLVLCENSLESLPCTVSNLKQLKSLLLHRNNLTALPVELIKLRNLLELSLRDNPLVVRFVRDLVYNPPSLMELAARTVKIKKVSYQEDELPKNLYKYLNCAHECVNPKCKGVYFDACVEHIKFVDFCGKYRVPLLQYLCSPKCSNHSTPSHEASDSDSEDDRMRRVLLG